MQGIQYRTLEPIWTESEHIWIQRSMAPCLHRCLVASTQISPSCHWAAMHAMPMVSQVSTLNFKLHKLFLVLNLKHLPTISDGKTCQNIKESRVRKRLDRSSLSRWSWVDFVPSSSAPSQCRYFQGQKTIATCTKASKNKLGSIHPLCLTCTSTSWFPRHFMLFCCGVPLSMHSHPKSTLGTGAHNTHCCASDEIWLDPGHQTLACWNGIYWNLNPISWRPQRSFSNGFVLTCPTFMSCARSAELQFPKFDSQIFNAHFGHKTTPKLLPQHSFHVFLRSQHPHDPPDAAL